MLIKRFEEHAMTNPDRMAIRAGKQGLTYGCLNQLAGQLARTLEQEKEPSPFVALLFGRCPGMITAILAALKAKRIYIPCDPTYPVDRLIYMLSDANAGCILTNDENYALAQLLQERITTPLSIINLDQLNKNHDYIRELAGPLTTGRTQITPSLQEPAYILYTSGSTGRPKGVLQTRENILYYVEYWTSRFDVTTDDHISLFASFCHDGSVPDIFSALLSGALLCIFDIRESTDITAPARWVLRERITTWHSVPTLYRYFINTLAGSSLPAVFDSLRLVVLGGEQVRSHDIQMFNRYFPGCEFANIYGQTESTVSSIWKISAGNEVPAKILIGEPADKTEILLIDADGNEVLEYETGEIVLASPYLAAGYVNDPYSTAYAFTPDDESEDGTSRLFWSGDKGRLLLNGDIEIMGRKDRQVKIRGFRIEPGEIESRLLEHELIQESVVLAREQEKDESYLCAYVVVKPTIHETGMDEELTATLRSYLSQLLPDYMVPSFFVELDSLPRTASGKIDRGSLPVPVLEEGLGIAYKAPSGIIEETLAGIWSRVLDIEKETIGAETNFLNLGGNSLKAITVASHIHRELDVKVPLGYFFNNPTIHHLARYIEKANAETFVSIQPAPARDYYPLSSAQKRIYFHQQMAPDTSFYNMPQAFRLTPGIDVQALENAFTGLIQRHESLRTSFHLELDTDGPVQRIHAPGDIDFKIEYLSSLPQPAPFDLAVAPLLRAVIVTGQDGLPALLFVDIHHIIADGMSKTILVKDFLALYNHQELAPMRLQYKDYALWQQTPQMKENLEKQQTYWLEELSGGLPLLTLPYDFPRPATQSFTGDIVDFDISAAETAALEENAKKEGATLFMVLVACFHILLAKLSGKEDIITGVPAAGRRHSELEKIIGMFVNTLAIRCAPIGDLPFQLFLGQVRERTLAAFENQDVPFEELVEKLELERDMSRNPVFDVLFVLQNFLETPAQPGPEQEEAGEQESTTAKLIPFRPEDMQQTSKFDLTLSAFEIAGQLRFRFEYSTALFKRESIERFIIYFKRILQAVLDDPQQRLSQIDILPARERERLLYELNSNGEIGFDNAATTVHEMFRERAALVPQQVAMGGPLLDHPHFRGSVTYGELDRLSDLLALRLQDLGVQPGDVVAIALDRSLELVTSLLGILKAGAAYLPVNPTYPQDRVEYLLRDSAAKVMINQDFYNHSGSPAVNSPPPVPNPCEVSPAKLAYVIYTSGSTGKPKGVVLEHRNLVNLLMYIFQYTNIDCSRTLQFAAISFDLSFTEIFTTIVSGGELCLIREETRTDLASLFSIIEKNQLHTVYFTASFLKAIFTGSTDTGGFPRCVRQVVSTGEQLVVNEQFRRYLKEQQVLLHNHYGPSETHVVTAVTLSPQDEIPNIPTIGKPLAGTYLYILDKYQQLLPGGVTGELYIGGIQVCPGYLNNPELTAANFLKKVGQKLLFSGFAAATSPYTTLYRTGDLARWLPDGNIDYLGRMDFQVKIRGFRIELGEIEAHLMAHEDVKEAAVIDRKGKNGDTYLCAYIVWKSTAGKDGAVPWGTGSDRSELLSEHLAKTLPDHMIPSLFVDLDRIPLTPNGKTDRRALPEPDMASMDKITPPRDARETELIRLWAEVLDLDEQAIGIDHNFFRLGGHSLKATALLSRIGKRFQTTIQLSEFFNRPSVRELATYLKEQNGSGGGFSIPISLVEEREYYPLSPAQKRLFVLQELNPGNVNYHLSNAFLVEGELDRQRLQKTFEQLICRHESLRTSFHVIDEEPVQKIQPASEIEFKIESFDGSIKHFVRPFDLSIAPLLRVGIIHPEANQDGSGNGLILVFDMHHIITDGVSQTLLTAEFVSIYYGIETMPAPLKLRYRDYAAWFNLPQVKEHLQKEEAYWLDQFSGELPGLSLLTDYPRPVVQDFSGSFIDFEISPGETAALNEIAKTGSATNFMVLMSIFSILLSKLSGKEDIIIGIPSAGRRQSELEKVIGMFVNTLVIRTAPIGDMTFKEFLGQVRTRALAAFENQDYPFEQLVDQLDLARDMSRNPVFDVMLAFQNFYDTAGSVSNQLLPGPSPAGEKLLKMVPYKSREMKQTAKFDLTLYGFEIQERLVFRFEYATSLFKEETIQRYIAYFKKIISQVKSEPGISIPVQRLEIIPAEEKLTLLYEFNQTDAEYPRDKTILQFFADQVQERPNQVALTGPSRAVEDENVDINCLTYRDFDEQTGKFAEELEEKGLQPGDIAAIMVQRSVEMMIAIFAVLKAGAAYLPIDPNYPQERIDYMLKDSSAKMIIGPRGQIGPIKDEQNIEDIETTRRAGCGAGTLSAAMPQTSHSRIHNLHRHNSSFIIHNCRTPLAYVIYTSGSTGKPKGVMVEHHSLVNRLLWMQKEYRLGEKDTVLFKTPFTFDVSVWEITWWAISGARQCILALGGEREPAIMVETIAREKVTVMHFVPSMLSAFMSHLETLPPAEGVEQLLTLRQVIASGEALTPKQVEQFNRLLYGPNSTRLANLYGPTEATIDVSYYDCTAHPKDNIIPIGKPIDNIRLFVLDKYLSVQPLGIPGELFIAGAGLARGYLDRPELTFEKFVRTGSSLLYKTGDLARWLSDGTVDYLGRIDFQVKVRGFRIECGEIESRLLAHEAVREALVLVRQDNNGDNFLCAYLVCDTNCELDINDIPASMREYLANSLPSYMVPAYFVVLEKMPVTPNGKIDRAALPQPGQETGAEIVAPRNALEEQLVAVWSDVLGREIGIMDNFFHVGGDSIKAIQLSSRLRTSGLELQIKDLFLHPRIADLAPLVGQTPAGEGKTGRVYQLPEIPSETRQKIEAFVTHNIPGNALIDSIYPLSPMQRTMLYNSLSGTNKDVFFIQHFYPLRGPIEVPILEKVFAKIIARHDIMRTVFVVENLPEPLQVVLQERPLDFRYEDISALPAEEKAIFMQAERRKDVERGFDLSRDMLIRFMLSRYSEDVYYLTWSNHYILLDGWCEAIVYREIWQLYHNLVQDQPMELEPVPPYRDYIAWLENQDKEAAIAFWQDYLAGYDYTGNLVPVKPGRSIERQAGEQFHFEEYRFIIEKEKVLALERLASHCQVTLNVVFQTTWGLLLQEYNDRDDVVFGAVVSGRPPEVEGIEKIVGLFINSLPVRVQSKPGQVFTQLLKDVQEKAIPAKSFEYLPLTEILSRCELKENIIDNLMTFQNIMLLDREKKPLTSSASTGTATGRAKDTSESKNTELTPVTGDNIDTARFHQSNYDFNLIINPVEPFSVQFMFNVDAFEQGFEKRVEQHLREIIDQVIENNHIPVVEIKLTYDFQEAGSAILEEEKDDDWDL